MNLGAEPYCVVKVVHTHFTQQLTFVVKVSNSSKRQPKMLDVPEERNNNNGQFTPMTVHFLNDAMAKYMFKLAC